MVFTLHIRDVYFSRYLDRPGLTLSSRFLSVILREREVTYGISSEWTLMPTRLRKLLASQYIPHVRLLVPRNMTRVNRRLRAAAAPRVYC